MNSQIAQHNMITQQLRTGDVLDKTILELFTSIPREDFVPEEFKDFAYSDMQINLPFHQRMLTPLEEGKLLQNLRLTGKETVLEIGTGTGFLTALLSKLSHKVISVEYYQDFTKKAEKLLKQHHCDNVELITGDGSRGWMERAPFDVVIITSALPRLSEYHKLQVLPGGKLLAILGKDPVMQAQLHTLSHQGDWSSSLLFETNVPTLIDKLRPKEFVF
jgi:protein-L-isoaspartate(D-aspartate) O-methyltransferase